MTPDEYRLRDLQRRITSLEKNLGYLKRDTRANLQVAIEALRSQFEGLRIEVLSHDQVIDEHAEDLARILKRLSPYGIRIESRPRDLGDES